MLKLSIRSIVFCLSVIGISSCKTDGKRATVQAPDISGYLVSLCKISEEADGYAKTWRDLSSSDANVKSNEAKVRKAYVAIQGQHRAIIEAMAVGIESMQLKGPDFKIALPDRVFDISQELKNLEVYHIEFHESVFSSISNADTPVPFSNLKAFTSSILSIFQDLMSFVNAKKIAEAERRKILMEKAVSIRKHCPVPSWDAAVKK